jgi:hypothetical protein
MNISLYKDGVRIAEKRYTISDKSYIIHTSAMFILRKREAAK